jgi:NitT/TauT family transport system ATP-binding protein
MAAHPGRIAEVIDVNLPRPRTEEAYATEEFREMEARVRTALRAQTEKAHV